MYEVNGNQYNPREAQAREAAGGLMKASRAPHPPTALSTLCAEVDDLVQRSDSLLKRPEVMRDRIGAVPYPSGMGDKAIDNEVPGGLLPLALDKLRYVRQRFTALEEAMSSLENTL